MPRFFARRSTRFRFHRPFRSGHSKYAGRGAGFSGGARVRPVINKAFSKQSGIRSQRIPRQIVNSFNPLPASCPLNLQYCLDFNVAQGTGGSDVSGVHNFYLNSVWEPEVGVTSRHGHGYTTMAAIYGQYKISYCDVELVWLNPAQSDILCASAVRSSQSTFTINTLQPSVVSQLPWGNVCAFQNTSSGDSRSWTQRIYINQVEGWGIKPFMDDTNRYVSNSGGNPSSLVVLQVGVGGYSNTTYNCNLRIRLNYHGIWLARKTVIEPAAMALALPVAAAVFTETQDTAVLSQ